MKLSISNLAWSADKDKEMYGILQMHGFMGLEIAPTRIFGDHPYNRLQEAIEFANMLNNEYNLEISSMQSIWFGRVENIFGSVAEREMLTNYTKKAILFAEALGCGNLVFGCPRNRVIHNDIDYPIAMTFFRELGEYARQHRTIVAIEPNPPLYNTNFINTTEQAVQLVRDVDSTGFRINFDFGTVIENGENVGMITHFINNVNHIHISEPGLIQLQHRREHKVLKELIETSYSGYISIEMKKTNNQQDVIAAIEYIKEVFGS
jgi:sugar phosphate isomerase/epimerase